MEDRNNRKAMGKQWKIGKLPNADGMGKLMEWEDRMGNSLNIEGMGKGMEKMEDKMGKGRSTNGMGKLQNINEWENCTI